jgi:hypothetical protein
MDASRSILEHIGRLALHGVLPEEPEATLRLLVAAGHREDDARRVLDQVSGEPREGRPLPVVNLSDGATQFLGALRDLGYLTGDMEDHVLDLVLAETGNGVIGLAEIRRSVAAVLFERQYELDPETLRFLEEEWRIAFH